MSLGFLIRRAYRVRASIEATTELVRVIADLGINVVYIDTEWVYSNEGNGIITINYNGKNIADNSNANNSANLYKGAAVSTLILGNSNDSEMDAALFRPVTDLLISKKVDFQDMHVIQITNVVDEPGVLNTIVGTAISLGIRPTKLDYSGGSSIFLYTMDPMSSYNKLVAATSK